MNLLILQKNAVKKKFYFLISAFFIFKTTLNIIVLFININFQIFFLKNF